MTRTQNYCLSLDKCLPFGLRSAPYLFNLVAEALHWIYVTILEFSIRFTTWTIFFFAGSPGSQEYQQVLTDMLLLCQAVQAPFKPEKVLGPTTLLSIPGIELDTIEMRARLPSDKLSALLEELKSFSTAVHTCTKRQLLSLIGKLAFACKIIPAGRIFLSRLLDTAHSVDSLSDLIVLTEEMQKDISWWRTFAQSWNGIAFFLEPKWTPAPDFQLFTDASGTLGFGAYWNGAWFSQPWSPCTVSRPIEWKELYAIVVACETWGTQWSGKRILFHCDNQAVVPIVQTSCI